MTEKQSISLYVAKSFALLTVIAAHMNFPEYFETANIIRTTLGQIGVIVFFFISGVLFNVRGKSCTDFFAKKGKTIVLPWFVSSVLTFNLSLILSDNYSSIILRFVKWFLGIGTWYWYLSVLLLLYLIFFFINNNTFLYISMIISLVTITLSILGIIPYSVEFNQYVNVFNWLGFFAAGMLVARKNVLQTIQSNKFILVGFFLIVVSTTCRVFINTHVEAYIDIVSLPVEIGGLLFILGISRKLDRIKVLIDIGKKSFFIYLYHIQIVGFINSRLPLNPFLFVLRPIIGLIVCYALAVAAKWIITKIKLCSLNNILGLDR